MNKEDEFSSINDIALKKEVKSYKRIRTIIFFVIVFGFIAIWFVVPWSHKFTFAIPLFFGGLFILIAVSNKIHSLGNPSNKSEELKNLMPHSEAHKKFHSSHSDSLVMRETTRGYHGLGGLKNVFKK